MAPPSQFCHKTNEAKTQLKLAKPGSMRGGGGGTIYIYVYVAIYLYFYIYTLPKEPDCGVWDDRFLEC